ncbi:MAG: FtsX-like permease family protein [Acidobacteria bacterium]|nr:FtsX-like permease family protein [Acidobacteriota bacterium]
MARALLRRLIAEPAREFVLGDLEEEFHDHVLPRDGLRAARRWYWTATFASVRAVHRDAPHSRTSIPRPERFMNQLLQNVRHTVRSWARQPSITAIALLALTLGIGANTAIFSVVYSVLLNPLPYPDDEQLMTVWLDNTLQGWPQDVTSYPNFADWREWNETFSDMAAVSTRADNLTGIGDPARLRAQVVSSSFFEVLGVSPLLGRGFTEEDWDNDARLVVLSFASWQQRFGSDRAVLGRTIDLNGDPHTIIGVMPGGFEYTRAVDHWRLFPASVRESSRGQLWLEVAGRLQPGVAVETARADMTRVAERLQREYPDFYEGYGVSIVPLHEQVVGDVRPALMVLLGAVGLVLLICCANVANLMLVRASSRRRELGVRAALGADRGRIFGQLLTEAVMLASLGGALGLGAAQAAVSYLRTAEPDLPRLAEVALHFPVLLFTLGIALATGLVFGVVPALRASRPDLTEVLGDRGTGEAGPGAARLRAALVVAEIGLAIVLLVGAGLMLRSYAALLNVSPGFEAEGVLSFRVSLSGPNYQDGDDARRYFDEAMERLGALPGVGEVGGVRNLPMGAGFSSGWFTIEGRPPVPRAQLEEVKMNTVTRGYFDTMRIPLLDGREFVDTDNADTETAVVVNDTFVRQFFPDEDPIGQRFLYGIPDFYADPENPDAALPWTRIVGVVGSVQHRGLDQAAESEVFAVFDQAPAGTLTFVLRADNPSQLAGPAREAIWAIDPNLPISNMQTLSEIVGATTSARRFNMTLLALFAGVAIVLAATGIYGVMSYWVNQQTREIGVRMALGAERGDVLRMVMRRTAAIVAAGVALGVLGALATGSVMSSLLFGVAAADPITFVAVVGVLAGVAMLASLVPAVRASGVDPMHALRDD